MKNIMLFCVLILTFGCIDDHPSSLDQSARFIKYFGTTGNEGVVDMVETMSGEILILGYTNTPNGDNDFYIVKTDSAGNGIWQESYNYDDGIDGNSASQDIPASARLFNNDQNLLAIGTSNISDTLRIFLLNIDVATGQAIESFAYQYYDDRIQNVAIDNIGAKSTSGADILYNEANDEFIILGSVETWSKDLYLSDPQSILLMSVDAKTFAPKWHDLTGLRSEDAGVKLIEDNGRYFYISTVTIPVGNPTGYGNKDVFVVEFNPSSGVAINSGYYGTAGADVPNNIVSFNNFLFVTGTSGDVQSEQAFFLRVPKSLPEENIDFVNIDVTNGDFNFTATGTQGLDLVRLNNGDVYIAGQINGFRTEDGEFKENEIGIFRVDAFGSLDLDNFRVYGSEDNDKADAIILRADGTLVIGATVDFGSTSMMSLLKTNVWGEFK
ncbi:hypothetical protein N6H18_16775 [Reichenbachiella agarivorans]|uniref:Uncharacterized protein n=1 Tax=Reichenbachiella agarivorans TaxID=2979464 RepID=A0ABY6CNA6_9BACT|nr:hypothetical protein [Reichenbachiella agarivorans]UXP32000.1 hypothetical protein N6H18_16775 [Reichenbachiella agarivorans]